MATRTATKIHTGPCELFGSVRRGFACSAFRFNLVGPRAAVEVGGTPGCFQWIPGRVDLNLTILTITHW